MSNPPRILVVDDEGVIAMTLQLKLKALGYDVPATAHSGEEAMELAGELKPDLVLMDINLNGEIDGIEAAGKIWNRLRIPIIYLTAYSDSETLRRSRDSEPFGYVLKPFSEVELNTAILIALNKHAIEEARRTRSVRALAESEERFQILVEGVKDYALYLLDPAGKVATWSVGAVRMTGYSEADIVGQHFAALHTAPDIAGDKPQKILERAAREGRFETECRLVRKDGSTFWAEISISPLPPEGGRPRGHACVARDITEWKKAAEALREAEQRFRTLADSAPVMIWMAGADGQCNYFNNPWIEFTGRTLEHQLGMGWAESIFPDDRETSLHAYHEAFKNRAAFKMEYRLRRADGEYRWVLDHGIPLYTPGGEFMGCIGSCIDIHERKLAEVDDRHARAEAEKVNRMKDEFLATLSHELRTPLTPILGWTHILRSATTGSDDLRRGLDSIERNARTQKKLVEDLLDVSRIIAGKLSLDLAWVGLAQVIESAMDAVRMTADLKAVSVSFKMHNSVGPIMGDAARLQQIVWNLLNNAIKFSPQDGQVEIHLSRRGQNAEIKVVDHGEGFDPSFSGQIFDMFSQADSSSTRKFGGLGLGLSIVRHLVETHGGSVSAQSSGAGMGAAFTVLLPLPAEGAMKAHIKNQYPAGEIDSKDEDGLLKGLDLLVVDDDRDTRDFLKFALDRLGATTHAVESVPLAMKALSRHLPDIVISDLGMPDQDGYALIAQTTRLYPGLPVVALSAYARDEDRARALKEGFRHYVTKPVHPIELATVLAEIAGNRTHGPSISR